jgi:hypothetical protein
VSSPRRHGWPKSAQELSRKYAPRSCVCPPNVSDTPKSN